MKSVRANFAVIFIFVAAPLSANKAAHFSTTARETLERLQGPNAARYASKLYDNPEKWSYISQKIATGQPEWLQVAKLLAPSADGAFAEELSSDLASALLIRPANVLTLMNQSKGSRIIAPSEVCDAPFPSPGKQWLSRYKTRAITVVGNIRDVRLRAVRNECLRALRSVDLSEPPSAYE